MPVYKVTVTVRGVVSVQANSDAQAGTIAYDYLDRCVEAGRATLPVPAEVREMDFHTFVQAATIDENI